MNKKIKKTALNVLTTATLLSGVAAPAFFSGVASAATSNSVVGAVPSIASTGNYNLASIRIDESVEGNLAVGDVIVLTLPEGVEWNGLPTVTAEAGSTVTAGVYSVTNRVVNIKITGLSGNADKFSISTPVTVTSVGSGPINVNLSAPGTGIASGDYTVGNFTSGSATVTALSTPTRGSGTVSFGTVRIVENAIGELGAGETITLTLPSGYTWGAGTVKTDTNGIVTTLGATGSRTLTLTVNTATAARPGIIDLTTQVVVGSSAAKGDVTVSLGGTSNLSGDVVIGKYADWGISVEAEAAKSVTAGRDAQRIAKVTIAEDIPGSLIPGRTITAKLPENTRFIAAPTLSLESGNNIWATAAGTLNSDKTEATFTLLNNASTSAAELALSNVNIDVAPNVSGNIELEIGGTAGAKGTVVVANATKVVTGSADVKEVKVGSQAQAVGDITLTEGKKEGLLVGALELNAPAGVTFANVPTVKVEGGDIQLGTVTRANNNTTLRIPVSGQSSKASAIKISGLQVTVDRTVPEGDIKFSIGGTAVVNNATPFPNTSAGSVIASKVVTPAPSDQKATAQFVLGQSKYTVNGVEKAMDVAAFEEGGRTYLPVRFVAEALGVSSDNVLWNQADWSVTILKGDRVVKMTIGSNVMIVNGVSITMDVPAKLKDERTFLPIRYVAQALGAEIEWDDATQTVTVKQ